MTFEVDNNGVLHVKAKNLAGGKTEGITINNDQNRYNIARGSYITFQELKGVLNFKKNAGVDLTSPKVLCPQVVPRSHPENGRREREVCSFGQES